MQAVRKGTRRKTRKLAVGVAVALLLCVLILMAPWYLQTSRRKQPSVVSAALKMGSTPGRLPTTPPAKKAELRDRVETRGEGVVDDEGWPPLSARDSPLWIFIPCVSQRDRARPPPLRLGALAAHAQRFAFRILVCATESVSFHHEFVHQLPPRWTKAMFGGTGAGSYLGSIDTLKAISDALNFKHLLILSPNIRLGADEEDTFNRLQGWLAHRRVQSEGGTPSTDDKRMAVVVVPTILDHQEGSTAAPFGRTGSGVAIPKDSEIQTMAQSLQVDDMLPILSQGLALGEGGGGRVTVYPRLHGFHRRDNRALGSRGTSGKKLEANEVAVEFPSGIAALISNVALENSLAEYYAKRESAHPDQGTRTETSLTPETAFDLSMVLLGFGSAAVVAATDVTVTYVSPQGQRDYSDSLQRMAVAGGKVNFPLSKRHPWSQLDTAVPSAISSNLQLQRQLAHRYDPELQGYHLYWDAYCGCTGINVEAINFLVPLSERIATRAVAAPDCWCTGFPLSDQWALERCRKPKAGSGVEWQWYKTYAKQYNTTDGTSEAPKRKVIWVSHKPVDAFPSWPYRGAIDYLERPFYVIGRTMIEHDLISTPWVRRLNKGVVNEVWVPSSFLVEAFYESGVKRDLPIVVIPEAIDTDHYDPELYRSKTVAPKQKDQFRFLSNFKWEARKGWDILLSAYFSEFSKKDPVTLVLKTYLYMDSEPRDVEKIAGKVKSFATGVLNLPEENLAEFEILAEETPASAMPALYASADCFVLPTRGEGWGLPLQEAMAMGLPTIGTNWSGNTEFMTKGNSFLLKVDRMVPTEDTYDVNGRLPKQAEPSVSHLKELMRYVLDHPAEAAEVGRKAREHIHEHYSRDAVADRVMERLKAVKKLLERS